MIAPGKTALIGTGTFFSKVVCASRFTKQRFYAQIAARSNTFGTGIYIHEGIVDGDYSDEIMLGVRNTLPDHYIVIRKHSPLAQLRFADFFPRKGDEIWINNVCAQEKTNRKGGFGSTTNKAAWMIYAYQNEDNTCTYTKKICIFDKLVEKKFRLPAPRPYQELSQTVSKFLPQTQIEFVPFELDGNLTSFPVPIKTADN